KVVDNRQGETKITLKPFESSGEFILIKNQWNGTPFDEYLLNYNGPSPSVILFDLGISIFHYEESTRGFSFSRNEPLDMRLNVDKDVSASDIVNTYSEKDIATIIFTFGEERYGRIIAKAICKARDENPITMSDELAKIIYSCVPPQYRHQRIHPATRTFQALRIAVNSEIERIIPSINRAIDLLAPNGFLGVISFHSLEDRPVKHLFREREKGCTCPPKDPICTCGKTSDITIITRKPISATEQECRDNPPSRSAKLRVAQKKGDFS
ncbi:MAG: 16S rRNA (cytosine(1402)-N(4))-methyltransferase, partial [Spirochaetia bacterium]|nr:16S rRNA (cytosine(1402)-N(4))-methyltransferase [Spirochaetia bacterium]